MTKTDWKVTLLIATLFGMVEPMQTTRKIDRVRKRIRPFIKSYNGDTPMQKLIEETNDSWVAVKERLNTDKDGIQVSLSLMIEVLYQMVSEPNRLPFKSKLLYEATRSLSYGFDLSRNVEKSTIAISNAFREELGIKERETLSTLRNRISMMRKDAILSGG